MRTLERLLKKFPRSNSYRNQNKAEAEVSAADPAIGACHPHHADHYYSGPSVKRADSFTSTSANNFSTAPNSPSSQKHRNPRAQSPSVIERGRPIADASLLHPSDQTTSRRLSPSPAGSASDGFISEYTPTSEHDSLVKQPSIHFHVQEVELSAPSSVHVSTHKPQSIASTNITAYESPKLTQTHPLLNDDEPEIMQRKVWVRRPGASATLVVVRDDDLVDAVRDVILHKYANSLGRSIDSPDIAMKIVSRDQSNKTGPIERVLGPEECIGRTLDSHYPGGQTIEEALIIEVPSRRTPKPSPRIGNHHAIAYPYFIEDPRPPETGRDYFPPVGISSPHLPAHSAHPMQANGPHVGPHGMAILNTGHLAPLPSPGAHSTKKYRPKYVRQHTSSPTIMHSTQPHSNADIKQQGPQAMAPAAPLPTPPAQADHRPSITPPNPRTTSPHPARAKRRNKGQQQQSSAKSVNGDQQLKPPNAGLLDGNVPPINILIVEDNPINLRLLEQFMRRLKVRFKTAMNGREAVNTWRTGGFHLVLMDIQLPVMNGLEATKEIRRLESVNGIGLGLVGGQSVSGKRSNERPDIKLEDKLTDMNLFKSPVIIVALTASSLQSDRHEALAVGCNDFLTKPVGYPWMSRKVTEWGCMQALIDFDGWRQWKASVEKKDEGLTEEQKKLKEKEEKAKQKAALKAMFAKPPQSAKDKKEIAEREPPTRPTTNGTSTGQANRANRNVRGSSGSGMVLETHEEETED